MHLNLYFRLITMTCVCLSLPFLHAQISDENSQLNNLPQQSVSPEIETNVVSEPIFNVGAETNLVRVLQNIRELAGVGKVEEAQKVARIVLEKITENE